jgi:hypothetical protein
MAVGNLSNRHEFPQKGTNQGENNRTAEEGGWSYKMGCCYGTPKFHTFDYRQEGKTRPLPKWVIFS